MDEATGWKVVCALGTAVLSVIGCAMAMLRRGAPWGVEEGRIVLGGLAAGVILTTALVHMVPKGRELMEGHVHGTHSYPYGMVMVVVGVLVAHVVETELPIGVGKRAASITAAVVLLGVLVHSVVMGVTMGTLEDAGSARALTVALMVHQLCEGAALGPVFEAGATTTLPFMMYVGMFAVSIPAGIGIGVVATPLKSTSGGGAMAQGVLMSAASGLLVYTAFREFIVPMFELAAGQGANDEERVAHGEGGKEVEGTRLCGSRLRLTTYAALCVGSGAMAALAALA